MPPPDLQHDLDEAREALEYWERRERDLPRRKKAARREASDHVLSGRRRVEELERRAYGGGARGVAVQLATEGRLPEPARRTAKTVAKRGKQAAVVVVVASAAVFVLALAIIIAVLVALL